MTKDLITTFVSIVCFLLGISITINSVADWIEKEVYAVNKGKAAAKFDPDRPMGYRYYSSCDDYPLVNERNP